MVILLHCSETATLSYGPEISQHNQHQNEECKPHIMLRLFAVGYTLISVFERHLVSRPQCNNSSSEFGNGTWKTSNYSRYVDILYNPSNRSQHWLVTSDADS